MWNEQNHSEMKKFNLKQTCKSFNCHKNSESFCEIIQGLFEMEESNLNLLRLYYKQRKLMATDFIQMDRFDIIKLKRFCAVDLLRDFLWT